MKKLWISFLFIFILSLQLLAHEGEHHSEEKSTLHTSFSNGITHEITNNDVEILVKHPLFYTGQNIPLQIFVSDAKTNLPLSNLKILLQLTGPNNIKSELKEIKSPWPSYEGEIHFEKKGNYTMELTLSDKGESYRISPLQVIDPPQNLSHNFLSILFIVSFILLLIILFKKNAFKKSCCKACLFLIFFLTNQNRLGSHEGHNEAPSSPTKNISSPKESSLRNNPNLEIYIPKESQFLLGLQTTFATSSPVEQRFYSQGKLMASPSGKQDIITMSGGRIKSYKGKIPSVGQSFKKGEILAYQSSIGDIYFKAPFNGFILESNFQDQQWVAAGSKIFTLIKPNPLWVEVPLYEKDIKKIGPQTSAKIKLAKNDETLPAKIIKTSPAINETNGSTSVFLEIENPNLSFKIGEWIEIEFQNTSSTQAIVVPHSAIFQKEKKDYVLVKKNAEHFILREVKIMSKSENQTYLLEGLFEGEKILSASLENLSPLMMRSK